MPLQQPQIYRYAHPAKRLAAYVIDSIVLGVPLLILTVLILVLIGSAVATKVPTHSDELEGGVILGMLGLFYCVLPLLSLLISWLYYALMDSSSMQGTVGKKILGLRITDMSGNRITFGKASIRFFGQFLSSITIIGYLMLFFTEHKQNLHDLIANTLVLEQ